MVVSASSIEDATSIVRALTGGRWTWPPVQARELYEAPVDQIWLRGRPVIEVTTVEDYETGDPIDYTLFASGKVELHRPDRLRCDGRRRVDVTYTYGSKPSTLVTRAINTLASELDLASAGSANCRLPERVTSVNRQGVSWTVLDPQDFLENGRTGIYEVDLAIKALAGVRVRTRVSSPEFPPPERVSTVRLPDPTAPAQ